MSGYSYKDEDLALLKLLAASGIDTGFLESSTPTEVVGALSQVQPSNASTTSRTSLQSNPADTQAGTWSSLGLPSILASGGGALAKLGGAYAGLPPIVTSPLSALTKSYLGDSSESSMKRTVGDSLLNSALSTAIPGIGIPLSLLGLTGFSMTRGLGNLLNPNTQVPESWRGGFWDKGYEPDAGSIMSSGNAEYSPYGGLSLSEQASNTSGTSQTSVTPSRPGYDSGSAYGSSGYGPTSSESSGDS